MPSLLIYVIGDRIGDALLKLPVVLALRQAAPGHRITWMAGRRPSVFKGPLRGLVDGVLDEVRDCANVGVSLMELVRRPLGCEYFDVIVDTQQRVATTLALKRIPHGLFVSAAAGFLLSDRRPARDAWRALPVDEGFRRLVCLALGRGLEPVSPLPLPAAYLAAAGELLPPGPCYIGLAPGAGGARKCWPLTAYLALANAQAAAGRVPVFFLGPGEFGWQRRIAHEVAAARFPEDEYRGLLERGPLLAMALGGRLSVAVANDAGAGHLLAAAGRPVITLFAHTDPAKFAPRHRNRIVLTAREFGGRTMADIPVDAVAARINRALGVPAGDRP